MTSYMIRRAFLLIVFSLIGGCASFHERPLSPAQTARDFEARTLTNPELRKYLESNLNKEIKPWPPERWDFAMLTLAALCFNPDLKVAGAGWRVREAAVITAGERPNPSVSFTPQYHADPRGLPPWTLTFNLDVPIETAGKRGYRIARAKRLSDAARLEIANQAWLVRSAVRKNLLALYSSVRRARILESEFNVQKELLQGFKKRLAAGEEASFAVTSSAIDLNRTNLSLSENQKITAQARAALAGSLGLPLEALSGVDISFKTFKEMGPDLFSPSVRRQALTSRPDILARLQEYEAAQSALQLEIARQYPDIHLGPGYEWDQGDNRWSVGVGLVLPVLNRNQGPIAEAKARRQQAAARFTALQARVIEEADRALAGYKAALATLKTARSILQDQQIKYKAAEAMFSRGEEDRLSLLSARRVLDAARLASLEALVGAQRALGALEDAVRMPLGGQEAFPYRAVLNGAAR